MEAGVYQLAFRFNRLPDEIRAMPWRDFQVCTYLLNESRNGKD